MSTDCPLCALVKEVRIVLTGGHNGGAARAGEILS